MKTLGLLSKIEYFLGEVKSRQYLENCISDTLKIGNKQLALHVSNKIRECVISDTKYPDREYPNLDEYITENLPFYREIEDDESCETCDVYQANGFSSEADYLRYKYG